MTCWPQTRTCRVPLPLRWARPDPLSADPDPPFADPDPPFADPDPPFAGPPLVCCESRPGPLWKIPGQPHCGGVRTSVGLQGSNACCFRRYQTLPFWKKVPILKDPLSLSVLEGWPRCMEGLLVGVHNTVSIWIITMCSILSPLEASYDRATGLFLFDEIFSLRAYFRYVNAYPAPQG